MGQRRIEVNVADYSVSLFDGDTLLLHARAVVGKPDTPTPIFSNVVRYVLINPSWRVPDSIIRKEMLPRLAADPDYLTRHGYEMKTVDGRVTVRQPPGKDNALGRIAFMFPNDHSVYLHDTPARGLFASNHARSAMVACGSTGPCGWPNWCWAADGRRRRIGAAIGGPERTVFLPRPLPIHIEYFTEFINESGELVERPDVYGLTQNVLSTLSFEGQD